MSTTIEILAPYLPYGIEVTDVDHPGEVRFTIDRIGIDPDNQYLMLLRCDEHCTDYDAFPQEWYFPGVLPVLRPFADLREAEENKVLVAVLVAQLLVNDWASQYRYDAKPAHYGLSIDVFGLAGYMEDDEVQEFVVNLYEDWDWEVIRVGEARENACAHNPVEAIDCLRRNHFAVGLQPDQYIRKEATRA